ncbi:hypothetical protein [Ralstonia insidiosa]|uniref:Uncharacterized protein n=1 Tax=Ralstonia insidiosa TaxID=190721 RepID=A0A848NP56_9RALS|nr:hypothetical protein [Ralstonia insidiosa]NMV36811.1 hypothetical protein [Ralstonia insidiosa]
MKAKNAPPCARFAVVSNPGTLFARIEDFTMTLNEAHECVQCYDIPVDVMRVTSTGELSTEL